MRNLNYRQKLNTLKNLSDEMLQNMAADKNVFRAFLDFQAKLYKYSFEDTLLLYKQNPTATACATMEEWNKIGRYVKKGSHATYIFTDHTQKELKKVFDLQITHGRAFSFPVNDTIPTQHREKIIQSFGIDFPREVIENDFNSIFKFAVAKHVNENYIDFFNDFKFAEKSEMAQPLSSTEINANFKATVKHCVSYMLCEKFNILHEEYNDDLYFKHLERFATKELLTYIGNTANYISKNVITHVNTIIKEERAIENGRRSELRRNDTNERRIHVGGEHGSPRMENERPDFMEIEGMAEENGAGADGGTERNRIGYESGGRRRAYTGVRGQTNDDREVRQDVRDVHGRESFEQEKLSDLGGRMGQDLPTGRQGSAGDVGADEGTISGEIPKTANADGNMEMGNIVEGLGRRNHFEGDCVREEIEDGEQIKVGDIISFQGRNYQIKAVNEDTRTFKLFDSNKDDRFEVTEREVSFSELADHFEKLEPIKNAFESQEEPINNRGSFFDGETPLGHIIDDVIDNIEDGRERQHDQKSIHKSQFAGEDEQWDSGTTAIHRDAKSGGHTPSDILAPTPSNFMITSKNDIGQSSGKVKYQENIEAIRLLKKIDTENRMATTEEQSILAKFSGFGGIPQAFDRGNHNWTTEYAELKNLLTEDEYGLAKGSTLNAHYTSTEVIGAMYNGLDRLGFMGGNILEPSMGVGNFFGMLPENMKSKSKLYGVELDEITGKLTKQLYPNANIQITGFEKAGLQENFFDVAIGNVPFGNYKVNDPKFNKHNFLIHDYFIASALDKVKPDGMVAVITSKGTMDKDNASFRRYIAERAELLGAIRLPNNAFKQSAGTEVTSDILFLKKRSERAYIDEDNWVKTGFVATGNNNGDAEQETILLNQYYIDNPHMMLGEMKMVSGQFGPETALLPFPDKETIPFEQQLEKAISFLPKNILLNVIEEMQIADGLEEQDANKTIPADPKVKNFCHVVVDGGIYQRENSIMNKINVPPKELERVKGLIAIRDTTRNLLDIQLSNCSNAELKAEQEQLNNIYDGFVKKHGAVTSKQNAKYFSDDADYPLLASLEVEDNDKNITKAGIFCERTVSPVREIDRVETSTEALAISMNEYGYVNLLAMNDLVTNKSIDEIITDLQGVIFKNPLADDFSDEIELFSNWETADEYLSGDVVEKLEIAKKSAAANTMYLANVHALTNVQPTPLQAQDITVKLGSNWVDKQYYRQFITELLKANRYDKVEVNQSSITGTWHVTKPYSRMANIEATERFGTKRMDGYELIEQMLNQKNPRIYDMVSGSDSKDKRVLNKAETIAIKNKQATIKQEFKDWVFKDPQRREALVATYNKKFNSTRERRYDGSHLTFPSMNPSVDLRKHQADGTARILYGGNTLLAHVVGAGKTYTMIASAMEMKRLGLANKPCIVVPKHLVLQWSNDFKKLYPTANVLATTEKDFDKTNRKRFCAKIATGNWDAVIMSHSQFEKIPVSQERQERKLKSEISDIENALDEITNNKGDRLTTKELERQLKAQKFKLEKLNAAPRDNLVTFEQLGIDALFVDEAHSYKNKFMFTKMTNIAGLSRTASMKSSDMDLKCEYINELNRSSSKHGKATEHGVVFATGTPISNSMVEMYTMQSYLQRAELQKLGLHHFDNWASNFGETISALELAPSGQGFRIRDRFAKFVNLPELMGLYRQVADIQTAEMVHLPVPTIKGGKPITISVEPSFDQKIKVSELVERSEDIGRGAVKPEDDNMLCIVSEGRKCALDMRTLDETAEDYAFSKINACVEQVYNIYQRTDSYKLTQMIFCDTSTPKGIVNMVPDEKGIYRIDANANYQFTVYDDIKLKLMNLGVPKEEIAYIHEAKTDAQKEKLFSKMRSGELRILLGSTSKMGSGTNAQNKLFALHHLDCPYRPSDLEQRNGRIVRQGNENKEVEIYQYVTKGTFDSYLWQIVETKQQFIAQVMTGKNPSRNMEDIDQTTMNYAEVKAIATGNPLIKRKIELEMEMTRLHILEKFYISSKYNLENDVLKHYPTQIANLKDRAHHIEQDIELRSTAVEGETFSIKIGKKVFNERAEAGALLLRAVNSEKYVDKVIGNYKGFEIIPQAESRYEDDKKIMLRGNSQYEIKIGGSDHGNIIKIENEINGLDSLLMKVSEKLEIVTEQMTAASYQLTIPFEHEQTMKDIAKELTEINESFDIGKESDSEITLDDELADTKGSTPKIEIMEESEVIMEIEEDYEMEL